MRIRPTGIHRPFRGLGAVHPVLTPARVLPTAPAMDLGPFVVRRFVDFARTESMMCRRHA
ncbi:hypothetical protein FOE78_12660 [Microlunatus elymi]|uniref:Uncharacterized protein n=1 Tax=Microlunatus elymi TaxID=2596828 RepID=A0A516PZP3_9ACTN|nr:hypothetical protein [Microlunatus elymi]QDP96649.1 hypothetical protein FOE78_12660 [Microlunatus elymi]